MKKIPLSRKFKSLDKLVFQLITIDYIEDIARWREDMNFMFEWQEQISHEWAQWIFIVRVCDWANHVFSLVKIHRSRFLLANGFNVLVLPALFSCVNLGIYEINHIFTYEDIVSFLSAICYHSVYQWLLHNKVNVITVFIAISIFIVVATATTVAISNATVLFIIHSLTYLISFFKFSFTVLFFGQPRRKRHNCSGVHGIYWKSSFMKKNNCKNCV